jgi:hypothetical protein
LAHAIPKTYEHLMTVMVQFVSIDHPKYADLKKLLETIWAVQGHKERL